jgi:hypothetical protein
MLMLFALSATPKLLLHDLVANHKDTPLKCSADNTQQYNIAGFNCGCDNLVVESPFVANNFVQEIILPISFSSFNDKEDNDFISVDQIYASLRGPPLNAL